MSNDLIDTSDASEAPPPDDIAPNTNYSRWMTDMAAEIGHLKLHQLAIPGTHNSGTDRAGALPIDKHFAANQDNSFPQQLAAGARYLDLRLHDTSYKKTIGNKFPTYKFVEVFEFKHDIFSAGRRLEHLVRDVKNFVTANPGEIVILDFYLYNRGRNYSHSSLERCLPYFSSIKGLLIPQSASNSSINDIRKEHPGRSIILHFPHNYPKPQRPKPEEPESPENPTPVDRWQAGWIQREQIWSSFPRQWTANASYENVEALVKSAMKFPPSSQFWVIDASVFRLPSGPVHLDKYHPIRLETFKEGYQNAKIVMVDFIERPDTRLSVTDRCITLNRLRATDKIKPSAPSNLVVTAKYEDPHDGKFENTLIFKWNRAIDNLGVARYEIYRNNELFASTGEDTYLHKNFVLKNYTFKIKAIDTMGNHSDFSEPFDFVQDAVPPTIPEIKRITSTRPDYVHVVWNHSFDASGIAGYEIYLNGVLQRFEPFDPHSQEVIFTFWNLVDSEPYEIKIRARDIYDLYSEFSTIQLPPRPKPINPIYSIIGYDETNQTYTANVVWEATAPAFPGVTYRNFANYSSDYEIYYPVSDEAPTFEFRARQGARIVHQCQTMLYGFGNGIPTKYEFIFDATPPEQVSNLKVTSRTSDESSISWTLTDPNIESCAISLNQEPPTIVPKEQHTYTFEKLPLDEKFLVEVWTINKFNAISAISVPAPWKPSTLQVSKISHSSAELRWEDSSGIEAQYEITLNGNLIAQTKDPFLTLIHLKNYSDYRVEVRAFNGGGISEPATTTFRTMLAPPANLRFSQVNGRCRLAWNPVFGKQPAHEVTINGRTFYTTPGRWGYSFKLSDLSPGPAPHHFTFKVRAQLDGASSEASLLEKTLIDDVPPGQPGAPVVSDITETSATLTWAPSSDNVGVTEYRVVLNGLLVFTTQTPRYTFTKLTSGAYHQVYVCARDKDGNVSAPSGRTVFKTAGQPPAPPPPAPRVSITEETATSLVLTWGSLEGGSGVRILLNDEHWRDIYLIPAVPMINLTPSVEYTISVSVFDFYGQLSEPTVITHELKDVTPPSAPRNLRASTSTSDSVTLNWEESMDDIGICDYVIYSNQEYFDRSPLTQYTVTGLMNGKHIFEVVAMDNAGNISEISSVIVEIKNPSIPSNFRYKYAALRHILDWDVPEDGTAVIEYTIVLTGPGGSPLNYKSADTTLNPLLLRNTRYDVRITAITAEGESMPLISEFTTS